MNNSLCVFSLSQSLCDNHNMNNLAKFRELRGLSQRDLAEVLGVSQPTIQRAETEASSAKLGTFKQCADYFGVTLSDIFSDRTELEARLLESFRQTPPGQREKIFQFLEAAADLQQSAD